MKELDIKKSSQYWQKTAEHDYETMMGLFRIKRYSDALFYGHIVLEKIIKVLVVEKTKDQSPRIHDLTRLLKLSEIDYNQSDLEFLKEVNIFNIRTRYPDYKLEFYKKCNLNFSKKYFNKIQMLYKKLCQEIKYKI